MHARVRLRVRTMPLKRFGSGNSLNRLHLFISKNLYKHELCSAVWILSYSWVCDCSSPSNVSCILLENCIVRISFYCRMFKANFLLFTVFIAGWLILLCWVVREKAEIRKQSSQVQRLVDWSGHRHVFKSLINVLIAIWYTVNRFSVYTVSEDVFFWAFVAVAKCEPV